MALSHHLSKATLEPAKSTYLESYSQTNLKMNIHIDRQIAKCNCLTYAISLQMLLHPDYSQCAEDHAKALILIHNAFIHKDDKINKIFDFIHSRIEKNHKVTLISNQIEKESNESNNPQDSTDKQIDQSRKLKCRFLTSYANDNNSWGDFQTHRSLLGLVSVAVYCNDDELAYAIKNYEKKKDEFNVSLIDCRMILVKKIDDSITTDPKRTVFSTKTNTDNFPKTHSDIFEEVIELQMCDDEEEPILPDSLNFLFNSMEDYLMNIFRSLDTRRREFTFRGNECTTKVSNNNSTSVEESITKSSSLSILLAPIENKNVFDLDSERKSLQKRCLAREKKHLGDLYLQCGYPNDALGHYQAALDGLKQVNDWLWVGGCLEGICTASLASSKNGASCNAATLVNSDNIASPAFFRRTHNQSSSLRTTSSGKAGDTPKASANRRDVNMSLDLATTRQKRVLHHEEIIKKYEEAMNNYKKFSGAAVIAVEAAMKACRLLIKHEKRLHAAKFLENVIFINLQSTHKEEISLYYTLSELYSQLKFYRKSAFYKHYATMKMINTPGFNTALHHDRVLACMHEAVMDAGVMVDLEHPWITRKENEPSWFDLQAWLIADLIRLVELQGRNRHVVNYSISLIDQWYHYLSRDAIENYMHSITSRIKDILFATKSEKYEVKLNSLPIIRSVLPCQLSEQLRPSSSKSTGNNYGVFIYTPLVMGEVKKEVIYWVLKETCFIDLSLHNATSVTLTMSNLKVITQLIIDDDDTAINDPAGSTDNLQAELNTFTIEPNSCITAKLRVTPKVIGKLKLIGIRYQLSDLGELWSTTYIQNPTVSLGNPSDIDEKTPEIHVISPLPTLEANVNIKDMQANGVYNLSLLHGEYLDFSINVKNCSSTLIDSLTMSIQHTSNLWQTNNFFELNQENLQSQLPLAQSKSACVTIYVNESTLTTANDAPHCSVLDSIRSTITLKYWNSKYEDFYREAKIIVETRVEHGPRLVSHPYINGLLELPLLVQNPTNNPTRLSVMWKNSEVFNFIIEASTSKHVTLSSAEVRRCPPQVDRDSDWLKQCLRIEWRCLEPHREGVIHLDDIKFSAYLIQFTVFEKINIDLKVVCPIEEQPSTVALYRPLRLKSICEFSELSKLDSISVEDLYLKVNIRPQDGRDVVKTCFSGSFSVRADKVSKDLELLTSVLFLSSGGYCVTASLNYILLDKTEILLKSSNSLELVVPTSL